MLGTNAERLRVTGGRKNERHVVWWLTLERVLDPSGLIFLGPSGISESEHFQGPFVEGGQSCSGLVTCLQPRLYVGEGEQRGSKVSMCAGREGLVNLGQMEEAVVNG